MNTAWIIGTLGAIVYFAVFEAMAFRHPDRVNTLSHAIYTIGKTWPLSIFLMGMFCGGLAVHFFWHWCPDGSISTGWLPHVLPGNSSALAVDCVSINSVTGECLSRGRPL